MKVKSYSLSIRERDFILSMSSVVTVILFFVSGIGSYRIFIVYVIGAFLKGLNLRNKAVPILILAYAYSLYLDLNNGPIIYPSAKSYFAVALLAFIIVNSLISKSFKRLISDITKNQYFIECPSCHFNNIYLVGSCANCNYKKGDRLVSSLVKISSNVKGDKIPPALANLLSLGENEEILFYKYLGLFTRKLKNGKTILRQHLIITSANVVIVDCNNFHIRAPKSWKKRDVIPLSDIISIEGKIKYYYMYKVKRPFLIIRSTESGVYEIALSTFSRYVANLNEITTIVKKINPQVEISLNNLIGDDSGYSERDKRLLLLLPLILLLLALVLWRLFQYVRIHGLN